MKKSIKITLGTTAIALAAYTLVTGIKTYATPLEANAAVFMDSHSPKKNDSLMAMKTNNRLAFTILRKMVKEDKDMFFSPLGLTYALSMVNYGAGGQTSRQIGNIIGSHDVYAMREFYHRMMLAGAYAGKDGKRSKVLVKNTISYDPVIKLKSCFIDNAEKYYFSSFEKRTGRNMILTTEINFDGTWQSPFNEDMVDEDGIFYTKGGKLLSVSMMNKMFDNMKYYKAKNFAAIEMPYTGGFNMYVILPDMNCSTAMIAEQIDEKSFLMMTRRMKEEKVSVELPEFEMKTEYDLNNMLREMGMTDAFGLKADFSNITSQKLVIDSVRQRSKINVSTKKTVAKSNTEIVGVALSQVVSHHDEKNIEFSCNHPFLYIITDKYGAVNFIGEYKGV